MSGLLHHEVAGVRLLPLLLNTRKDGIKITEERLIISRQTVLLLLISVRKFSNWHNLRPSAFQREGVIGIFCRNASYYHDGNWQTKRPCSEYAVHAIIDDQNCAAVWFKRFFNNWRNYRNLLIWIIGRDDISAAVESENIDFMGEQGKPQFENFVDP